MAMTQSVIYFDKISYIDVFWFEKEYYSEWICHRIMTSLDMERIAIINTSQQ